MSDETCFEAEDWIGMSSLMICVLNEAFVIAFLDVWLLIVGDKITLMPIRSSDLVMLANELVEFMMLFVI